MHESKVRVPKQERSKRTREKIMKAGFTVFGQNGFHGSSVKMIADEAGISLGSFYTYFEDKKALFLELIRKDNERQIELALEPSARIVENPYIEDAIEKIFYMVLKYHNENTDFNRVAEAMRYSDEDVQKIRDEQDERVVRYMVSYLEEMGDAIRVTDKEAAVRVLRIAFISTIHYIDMLDPKIETERYVREFAEMFRRYLFYMKV